MSFNAAITETKGKFEMAIAWWNLNVIFFLYFFIVYFYLFIYLFIYFFYFGVVVFAFYDLSVLVSFSSAPPASAGLRWPPLASAGLRWPPLASAGLRWPPAEMK